MDDLRNALRAHRALGLLVLGLAAAVAIYLPGLWGSFVFDDSTFVVTNARLHVSSLDLADWVAATLSFPAGAHQGRWLGMLSFAVNYYLTGLDPFWMKATNVAIHALNGALVFLALRTLFDLHARTRGRSAPAFDGPLVAAAIACLWLVLPINLTAVLYVSQRLESLSNTFVFLGLWLYLRARIGVWEERRSAFTLGAVLAVTTGIGVLVKESAVMLPLYALCVEIALADFRGMRGERQRTIVWLFGLILGIPLLVGSVWLLSWVGGASSYARPFTIFERLLTESRVLCDYIGWTLVPQPESMTLYHDDIIVSRGLMTPPTTIVATLALLALLALAFRQRLRRPLLSLGLLWFFSGHILTGTVIPLMLAFEHRNYFPSLGLLLAGASFVTLEGGVSRTRMRVAIFTFGFLFYAFVTWMRAEEWSDPLRLALSEAAKRPDSSAAQYELASTYLRSTRQGDDRPMSEEAFKVLERAAAMPNSDILHEQLLIVAHAQLGLPIEARWWDSIIAKLNRRPPTTADIGAMGSLFRCQMNDACPHDFGPLRQAFEAAVRWPQPHGVLLSLYGEFAANVLNDPGLAEREFRASLQRAPNEPETYISLIRLLIATGQREQARNELDALKRLNHLGWLDRPITDLEASLARTKSGNPPAD